MCIIYTDPRDWLTKEDTEHDSENKKKLDLLYSILNIFIQYLVSIYRYLVSISVHLVFIFHYLVLFNIDFSLFSIHFSLFNINFSLFTTYSMFNDLVLFFCISRASFSLNFL